MGRITHKIIDAGKYVRYVPGSKVQAFRKLGQLEDLMEKYNIDDIEKLDILLGCAIKNQEKIVEVPEND